MIDHEFKQLTKKITKYPNRKVMFADEQKMLLTVMEWLFRKRHSPADEYEDALFKKAMEATSNVANFMALNNRWFEDQMNVFVQTGNIPAHKWDAIQDRAAEKEDYSDVPSIAKDMGIWDASGEANTNTISGQMDGHNA